MSAIQSQAPPARIQPRVPRYVYVAAILLLGWGSLVFWAFLALSDEFGPHFWKAMVPVALELTIGAGLLFRRRWAWILGIATSVVFFGEGLRRLIFVHVEYEWSVALIDYLLPALVILVCLLPGRARRAFLGERQAEVV